MSKRLSVDKAGRIVIPKNVRERLRIAPGDPLEIESDEDRITLRPVRSKARLVKEKGIWVYQGEVSDYSITDLIDRVREARNKQVTG
jgi:AbrB family looped-hinge helix DNA binding protein